MNWFLRALCLFLLALPAAAQTQLDPSFLPQLMYQPTQSLKQAAQLADGSRILAGGTIWRAEGVDVDLSLVKYLPSGQLDAAFNAQVAQYQFTANVVAEAPGNKLVVGLYGPGTFGTQTHYGVVRLLASGALDPSFAPQPAASSSYTGTVYLVQADGKIIVANEMARALSQSVRTLARLNVDGTPDATFNGLLPTGFSTAGARSDAMVRTIRQQPDGKLLVAHSADATPPAQGLLYRLVRLLPSGAADTGFSYSGPLGNSMDMSLQPDGKILLASSDNANVGVLIRLQPSGAVDASFQAPTNLTQNAHYDTNNLSAIQVQANGRILVASVSERTVHHQFANSFVVRLLATGALDPSWQPPLYGDYQVNANHIQLLPNGQVLVAGDAKLYASATALPSAAGLLDANGANVASFAPVLQQGGVVLGMARQADGRIVAGGDFTEINGTPTRNLARFNTDGTLDASFTANAAALGGYVRDIQLQTDGKIVIGGQFISAGGQARTAVARLLPSGLCDPTFTAALSLNSASNIQEANHIAIQPDGQILASGSLMPAGAAQPRSLLRFTTTGVLDASFQSATTGIWNYVYPLLVQPDGKIITAGIEHPNSSTPNSYELVARLLPNGSLDPSFARIATGRNGIDSPATVYQLELYPDGRLLVGGYFSTYGASPANNLVRLLPTGVPDASFVSPITSFIVQATAIQPNGRIMAAGVSYYGPTNPPMIRLLNDGSFDASFVRAQGPAFGSWVRKLLIQPDGGVLVAGQLYQVAGQIRMGLVRLLDTNVLHVASAQTTAKTLAYPVPAHDELHLELDAASRPTQVQLLDAQGRVVRSQTVVAPTLTLTTADLPTGLYLLQVDYATAGRVSRRIVIN